MKTAIHPQYYDEAKIRCACGNVMILGSTQPEVFVELCSHCHPFYTGKQKLIDTAGRLEKFQKKIAQKEGAAAARKGKKVKKARASVRKDKKEK